MGLNCIIEIGVEAKHRWVEKHVGAHHFKGDRNFGHFVLRSEHKFDLRLFHAVGVENDGEKLKLRSRNFEAKLALSSAAKGVPVFEQYSHFIVGHLGLFIRNVNFEGIGVENGEVHGALFVESDLFKVNGHVLASASF